METKTVNSVRMPMLIQARLFERTQSSLMHFKWEVTSTHGNQPIYILNGAACE